MLRRVLGPRTATARKARGLTQEQLAERTGVAPETIGRIERGEVVPSLERLEQIAHALGLELADLVRPRERAARRDLAIERVLLALRARPVEDVELAAEILERLSRRR